MWPHVRPKEGTIIEFHAVVRGGDGNKMGRTLGTILVAAASFWVGGAVGAAYGSFTGALAAGAVAVVGGIMVNRLFPPPKPPTEPGEESPTYAIEGGTNQMRRYEPFVRIMGTHKIFPDFGAQPYNEFQGEDQYGYYIFDLGYNDVDIALEDMKLGDTPLSSFTGVQYEISGADGKLTLFPGNVDTVAGEALTAAVGWIQRTSSDNAAVLAVEITGLLFSINNDGNIGTQSVTIEINYRKVGTTTWFPVVGYDDTLPASIQALIALSESEEEGYIAFIAKEMVRNLEVGSGTDGKITMWNNNRKPLRRTYSWPVAEGQYEIRVRRVSADSTDEKHISDIAWSQLRTYQPDTADYTGRKRIALKVRATGQISGSLPAFNCIVRAKTLAWNGSSWVNIETSNPAWWYLNTLRGQALNGRRIWGALADDSTLDIEGIKAFATWCDQQGLTFNAVWDQQTSVFDVLQAIALMGRGTPSWGTGKLGVVWDAPDLPITAVFGMHNIVAGSFEIEYSTEDLADVVEGEFINPDLDWQRDYVRTVVPGALTETNTRRVELFGCTDKELAAEQTNLYAATNAYRNRRYKWTCDWEAMPSARGDVVELSHDLASLDYSGRLVEGSSDTQLVLPIVVPLYISGAFVVIVKPDGSFATYAVQAGTGETNTLTLVSTLPFDPSDDADHPVYDYRWLYGPTATPGKKVKIDSFRPVDERHVELTAIDELPIFYTAKDNPYTYTPPTPLFGQTPVIKSLTLTPTAVRAGKGYLVQVGVSWVVEGGFSVTDVAIAVGEGPLMAHASNLRGTSTDITIEDRQEVEVQITVFSNLGRLAGSAKASVTQFIDFTGSKVPGDVSNFFISGKLFTWDEVPDLDVVGYKLRFHLGNRTTWEDASPLHEGVITEHDWEAATLPLDDGVVTYLIKAIDAAGQESETPAVIVQGLGDETVANVLEVIDYRDLGWPGTITGGTIVSGSIEADTTTAFYGPNDADPFYEPSDAAIFYPADEYEELTFDADIVVPSAPLYGSVLTVQHVLAGDGHYVEWKQDGVGPFYTMDDSDVFYTSDSDPLYDVSSEFIPWTGARVIEPGDRYFFRLRASGGPVQGVFDEFLVTIDAPDIEEEFNNIVIAAPSGTRLPITKPFTSIKSVQGTLEDDGGDAVTIEIVDRDPDLGPLVRTLDADKIAVSGRADFRVKGW
jgi:hypothetical protein